MMNVVLYFQAMNDIKKFCTVSKRCYEAVKGVRINPRLKKINFEHVLKLFPNIQTIYIHNLSCHVPHEILLRITYIRVSNTMNITKCSKHQISQPRNYDKIYFNKSSSIVGTKKTTSKDVRNGECIGKEIFMSINGQKYIHLKHPRSPNEEIIWSSHLNVFSILSSLRNLKNVYLHFQHKPIDDHCINTIKSLPYLQFTLILYSFHENSKENYDTLLRMSNVTIFFSCLTKEVLLNGYLVNLLEKGCDGNMYKYLKYSEHDIINSSFINNLHNLYVRMYTPIYALDINHFEMSSSFDLSLLPLISLKMGLYSITPVNFIIPTSLTSLDLSIQCDSDRFNTPKLMLNSANISQLHLYGFEYPRPQQLHLMNFPNKIVLRHCSNITLTTEKDVGHIGKLCIRTLNCTSKQTNHYEFDNCSNVSLITKQSVKIHFIEVSIGIIGNNMGIVSITDAKCSEIVFESISSLYLSLESQLMTIQLPTTLEVFEFNIIPSDENTTQTHDLKKNQVFSLEHTQIYRCSFDCIRQAQFILPTTISYIYIINCTDVEIKTMSNCNIEYCSYINNVNCKLENLYKDIVYKMIPFEIKDSGIIYEDITVDGNFRYSDDWDDYNENELEELIDGVTIIGETAFKHKGFKHIEFPNSVKKMECGLSCSEYIKQDDTEYKNVKAYSDEESLPNFATQLSDRIFFRSNKTKIEIPTNITKVGNNGFSGSEILSFVFGNELTKLHALKFGSECFTSCRFLNYVNILNTIGSFEKRCFSSCYRLETFRCNYSHHLGESLFESSKSLREVYIGDGAEELPKRCFWLCINLQTVKLPTTLTTMDTECFYKCESLTSIHIPKHVTCIPTSCFLLCESCTSITLPTGITSFGPKSFHGCFSLKEIILPQKLSSIPEKCFSHCYKIQTITIPTSVTLLDTYCFLNCYELKTLIMPSTVSSIGSGCFYGCRLLSNIQLPYMQILSDNTFSGCYCFNGCVKLTKCEYPQDCNIEEECFTGCKCLDQTLTSKE
ncbi:hypothetical protein QTN25_008199 [Entamoeba marina]